VLRELLYFHLYISDGSFAGYSVREELPLPDKPPYTVHLGNLSFDATIADVNDFFAGCEITNVRIIEDKELMKPKGFGYAEFGSLEGLKQALTLNGSQFQSRNIRISVADPRKPGPMHLLASVWLIAFDSQGLQPPRPPRLW
jgi:RNA recognition motif-containing protein